MALEALSVQKMLRGKLRRDELLYRGDECYRFELLLVRIDGQTDGYFLQRYLAAVVFCFSGSFLFTELV